MVNAVPGAFQAYIMDTITADTFVSCLQKESIEDIEATRLYFAEHVRTNVLLAILATQFKPVGIGRVVSWLVTTISADALHANYDGRATALDLAIARNDAALIFVVLSAWPEAAATYASVQTMPLRCAMNRGADATAVLALIDAHPAGVADCTTLLRMAIMLYPENVVRAIIRVHPESVALDRTNSIVLLAMSSRVSLQLLRFIMTCVHVYVPAVSASILHAALRNFDQDTTVVALTTLPIPSGVVTRSMIESALVRGARRDITLTLLVNYNAHDGAMAWCHIVSTAAGHYDTTEMNFCYALSKVNPAKALLMAGEWLRLVASEYAFHLAIPLLTLDPSIASQVMYGCTLLAMAIDAAHEEIVDWYECNAPENFNRLSDNGDTPLHQIICNMPTRITTALNIAPHLANVMYNGPETADCKRGDFPLHACLRRQRSSEVIAAMIAKTSGELINADGDSALGLALRLVPKPSNDVLDMMVSAYGASNHRDSTAALPLHLALIHAPERTILQVLRANPAVARESHVWDTTRPAPTLPLTFAVQAALGLQGYAGSSVNLTDEVISRLAYAYPEAVWQLVHCRHEFDVELNRLPHNTLYTTISGLLRFRIMGNTRWIPRYKTHIRNWTTKTHRLCTESAQEVVLTLLTIATEAVSRRESVKLPRFPVEVMYLVLNMFPRHQLAI